MIDIVGVRFTPVGKIYYFSPAGLDIKEDDNVIVETARGLEFGSVIIGNRQVSDDEIVQPLKNVIRIATEQDFKQHLENGEKEKQAIGICNEKIKKHNLNMKLVDVEFTFDASKILFYFVADGRIDFRELVKDLASVFKARIELRQIGVRDEAKMLGGLGICGREFCCSSFLGDFEPVSIKMAKEQSLSLNPTKISGTCGRLMCCLKYEQSTYEKLIKTTPHQGAIVKTPAGTGTVEYVDLLKGKLKVKIDSEKETQLQDFNVKDVKIIKNAEIKYDLDAIDKESLKVLEDR